MEEVTREGVGRKVVLEVGAGAGNTAFPIVRGNANPELRVHAVDFSKAAVETMRNAEGYQEENEKGVLRADVWDVAAEDGVFPEGVTEGSVDIVIMIFIFSALSPRQWAQAVRNIYRLLKPGGEVLFRDYGRGDLAQVRFKAGRWMEDNFYVRGDGTRVYFFEKEELERIWGGRRRLAEAPDGKGGGASAGEGGGEEEKGKGEHDTKCSAFEICNLDVDRRLIVNRQKRIKMYRCWIQGRFRKPIQDQESTVANTGNNAS